MKILDYILCVLLLLCGCGHTAGTLIGYQGKPELMLWSLSASLFIFTLGSVNLIRAGRKHDRPLAIITLVFNLCQVVAALQFGRIIGNLYDPRVIAFAVICLGLSGMSVRSLGAAKA